MISYSTRREPGTAKTILEESRISRLRHTSLKKGHCAKKKGRRGGEMTRAEKGEKVRWHSLTERNFKIKKKSNPNDIENVSSPFSATIKEAWYILFAYNCPLILIKREIRKCSFYFISIIQIDSDWFYAAITNMIYSILRTKVEIIHLILRTKFTFIHSILGARMKQIYSILHAKFKFIHSIFRPKFKIIYSNLRGKFKIIYSISRAKLKNQLFNFKRKMPIHS